MKSIDIINKTREYLDYLEEHILNVSKAWKEIKVKCKDMRFIYDDYVYWSIQHDIENHDLSKFSKEEFVDYRKFFFPTSFEEKHDISDAWKHHLENNHHHWENFEDYNENIPYLGEVMAVHMVCDWLAMSYKFGDTPKDYYEKNRDKIKLPEWVIDFIYEIFDRLDK